LRDRLTGQHTKGGNSFGLQTMGLTGAAGFYSNVHGSVPYSPADGPFTNQFSTLTLVAPTIGRR